MTAVSVEAWSHGDGWLTADTCEWIADRGDYAADLTDALREWMDERGHDRPDDDVLISWIEETTGQAPVGLHGDGALWAHNLANFADHLIDDLGFVVFSAAELGDVMVIVSDHRGCYVAPQVYRSTVDELEAWADYAGALGECVHGHRWHTDDTVHLHADGDYTAGYRVPDLVRVPFGDRSRAFVACPACGKAVRFETRS